MRFDGRANVVAVDDDVMTKKALFVGGASKLVEVPRVGAQQVNDRAKLRENMKRFVTDRKGAGHARHGHRRQQEFAGRQPA